MRPKDIRILIACEESQAVCNEFRKYGFQAYSCDLMECSGARWFKEKREAGIQQKSIEFFMEFVKHPCKFKAIENPIGIMSSEYRKPNQIIQPWMFGHGETKATCLWLFGLPNLEPTNIVEGREQRIWKLPPSEDRAILRSKTYPGIAKAMAIDWGFHLINNVDK